MKKRIVAIVLICVLALSSGQALAADHEAVPYYNVVSAVNTSIASTDNGVMMKIWVCAPNSSALDKVNVEVTLKRASGAVAATYNQRLEQQNNVFLFDETKNVSVSSAYYFEFTAKCYKGGVLVDTLTGTSATIQHTV